MNIKLGPMLTKTNVINFMTKIRLRLGMLVNTTPGSFPKLNHFFPLVRPYPYKNLERSFDLA